jgi:hypothetical protein
MVGTSTTWYTAQPPSVHHANSSMQGDKATTTASPHARDLDATPSPRCRSILDPISLPPTAVPPKPPLPYHLTSLSPQPHATIASNTHRHII